LRVLPTQGGLQRIPQASQKAQLAGHPVIISDACIGLYENADEFFPGTAWHARGFG
jgi:hypothetical protein